ncbi:MAG: GGDEF domain-containing protein [Candidatus Omnitrophica bacterium]|jgi:diguanylate cyclase (GGDEF)-like protein|nr:GGDEF domain-containing protein [Candidatus Omnitrophota bacterium]
MFYRAVIFLLIIIFIVEEILLLKRFLNRNFRKKEQLLVRIDELEKELNPLKKNIDALEKQMSEHFFFYDLMRKISPFLNKKELFKVFSEEIKYLGEVEAVEFSRPDNESKYLQFVFGDEINSLYVKTDSKKIIGHQDLLRKLLELCIERINLYDRFQQLSIYDTLTETYNRRYLVMRFIEEFERAQKFSLKLSFIMIDVDNFKKINDTYGHLVGDAVLKEIAKIIKQNIREIDSLARFGGEEFSLILPETDKMSAIVVGERIRSKVSQQIIKAFDETLSATISAGVSSFPQNTLYSDVLMETADKALYQAKISGRNKVCWF